MASKQKTSTILAPMEIDIKMTLSLLRYLEQQHVYSGTSLTKGEAFRDLIDRYELFLTNGNKTLMNASISDLARAWNWDRATVKKFLARLEDFGVVQMTCNGRKVIACLSEQIVKQRTVNMAIGNKQRTEPVKTEMPTLNFEEYE